MRIRLRDPKKPDAQFKKFKTMKARLKRMKILMGCITLGWIVRELCIFINNS